MKYIFGLLAAIFCAGCAANADGEAGKNAFADIDVEACVAKGGEVRLEGLRQLPVCVVSYPDAGKVCTDSSECKGRCLASEEITDYSASGDVKGRCEADNSVFGCTAEIKNGKADIATCVD